MTIVADHRVADLDSTRDRRQASREELADLLERDPAELADQVHLRDDLALDSLALMTVIAWLDGQRVRLATDRDLPATVGEVLTLVEQAARPGVSITITNRAGPPGPGMLDRPFLPPAPDSLAPVWEGHALRLVPVTPDDVGFLYSLSVRPETCFRWRYRGAPPPFERFAEDLWKQVLVQFVVRRVEDNQPVGLVVAYATEPAMRYAYLGAVFLPQHSGTGLAAHATSMFVRYLFHTFPLQKLYLEIPGYNWEEVKSGEGRLFQVEGVLRGHNYYAGRSWDEYLCAIYRDADPQR